MTAPMEASGNGDVSGLVARLGFDADQIVQEFGYDDDCDQALREALEERIGSPMEDEDYTGEADAVLLWWRGDDGDLTDALVDTVSVVADGGFVALLTPRPGRGAQVEPSEIEEAAGTAGLHASGTVTVGPDWRGVRLVAPKGAARR